MAASRNLAALAVAAAIGVGGFVAGTVTDTSQNGSGSKAAAVAVEAPVTAGSRVTITKGANLGKSGTVTGYRVQVDGRASSQTYSPGSVRLLPPLPPPPPVTTPTTPTTTTPTTPTTPTPPADGKLIREYSFENTDNPFPTLERVPDGSGSLTRSSTYDPPGTARYAGLFRRTSTLERIEGTDYGLQFKSGDTVCEGGSLYLPESLKDKVPPNEHHSLMQMKQGPNTDGGPPAEIDLRSNGGLNFITGSGSRAYTIVPFDQAFGKWINLQWCVKLAKSGGTTTLWVNDQQAMTATGDTLGGGPNYVYLKFGDYGKYTGLPADVYWSNLRIGTTRSIVRPPGT